MFISPVMRIITFLWNFIENSAGIFTCLAQQLNGRLRSHPSPGPLSASCPCHGPPMSRLMSPIHTRVRWNVHFPILHAAKSPRWDLNAPLPAPCKKIQFSDENDFGHFHCLQNNERSTHCFTFLVQNLNVSAPLSPSAGPNVSRRQFVSIWPLLFARELERDRSHSPPSTR
jgi:hypothetical protein